VAADAAGWGVRRSGSLAVAVPTAASGIVVPVHSSLPPARHIRTPVPAAAKLERPCR
jgi:hypothetical protein